MKRSVRGEEERTRSAEVKRSVRVRVEAGENEIVLTGLPVCTEKNSIRLGLVSMCGSNNMRHCRNHNE